LQHEQNNRVKQNLAQKIARVVFRAFQGALDAAALDQTVEPDTLQNRIKAPGHQFGEKVSDNQDRQEYYEFGQKGDEISPRLFHPGREIDLLFHVGAFVSLLACASPRLNSNPTSP
jgi:hypothetical protein